MMHWLEVMCVLRR